jgi:hypothetical protein
MGNRPKSRSPYWGPLESKAHLPEIQAIIREAIWRGAIFVVPAPGGGIRIIPADSSAVEETQPSPHEGHEQSQTIRVDRVLRVARTTL